MKYKIILGVRHMSPKNVKKKKNNQPQMEHLHSSLFFSSFLQAQRVIGITSAGDRASHCFHSLGKYLC